MQDRLAAMNTIVEELLQNIATLREDPPTKKEAPNVLGSLADFFEKKWKEEMKLASEHVQDQPSEKPEGQASSLSETVEDDPSTSTKQPSVPPPKIPLPSPPSLPNILSQDLIPLDTNRTTTNPPFEPKEGTLVPRTSVNIFPFPKVGNFIVADSQGRKIDRHALDPSHNTTIWVKPGLTVSGLLERLEKSSPQTRPGLTSVTIFAGGNDLAQETSANKLIHSLDSAITLIRRIAPNASVFVTDVLPRQDMKMSREEASQALRRWAAVCNVKIIDFTSLTPSNLARDGIHLNESGIKKVCYRLKRQLSLPRLVHPKRGQATNHFPRYFHQQSPSYAPRQYDRDPRIRPQQEGAFRPGQPPPQSQKYQEQVATFSQPPYYRQFAPQPIPSSVGPLTYAQIAAKPSFSNVQPEPRLMDMTVPPPKNVTGQPQQQILSPPGMWELARQLVPMLKTLL